jgi:hypothetical protein
MRTARRAATDRSRLSLDAIAAQGFSRRHLGFLSWQRGSGASPNIYRLHLPPPVRR